MRRQREILSDILKDDRISPFEKKVYLAIAKIPRGQTRTYKWVAREVGRPRACRAVGNALNKNPYPIVIPCHRVIRSDGSVGGYSEGVAKKLKLLKGEKGIDISV